MTYKTLIICFTGHRDRITEESELDMIREQFPDAKWIHGGAKGFDTQVNRYAVAHHINVQEYRPEYHRYNIKEAPLRRNDMMLDRCDVVVACYDGRKKGGTWYTIKEARKRGLAVMMVRCVPMEIVKPWWEDKEGV